MTETNNPNHKQTHEQLAAKHIKEPERLAKYLTDRAIYKEKLSRFKQTHVDWTERKISNEQLPFAAREELKDIQEEKRRLDRELWGDDEGLTMGS